MALSGGLTPIDGMFDSVADLQASKSRVKRIVSSNDGTTIQFYTVSASDLGSGVVLDSGLFANPIGVASIPDPQTATNTSDISTNTTSIDKLKLRTPISGVSTVPVGFGYFATANATITMPDVTGFAGGEKFSIVASLAATLSTLTVDGTQSEEIAPRNGDATDTVFNLTTIGVSFEFIFNIATGNWEV